LKTLREQHDLDFVGFSELSAEQVSQVTELSLQDAHLAKQRMASEPMVGLKQAEQVLVLTQALSQRGLLLQKGGRFYTATSARQKSDAVAEIMSVLQLPMIRPKRVIVCGDSPNDLSMLALGDAALVFSSLPTNGVAPADESLDVQHEMKRHLRDTAAVPRLVDVCDAGHEAWLQAVIRELRV
jgi:predicted mannosyl-3-phosphoglycerate phosphatase (HAD superfamily)